MNLDNLVRELDDLNLSDEVIESLKSQVEDLNELIAEMKAKFVTEEVK
jgi:protein associated with RNAse G/E